MPLTSNGLAMVADAVIGGTAFVKLDATNGRLGVGNGTALFAAGQNDLQGVSKLRKGVNTGFPARSGAQLTFQTTFNTSEANFAWEEVGLFNDGVAGQMFWRRVQNLGTKTSSSTWVLEVVLTFTNPA